MEWGLELLSSDVWLSFLLGVLNILSAKLPSEREGGPEQFMELRLEEMENRQDFRRSGVLMEDTAMVLDMASENQSWSELSSVREVGSELLTSNTLVFSLSWGWGELGLVFSSVFDWDLILIGPFSVRILCSGRGFRPTRPQKDFFSSISVLSLITFDYF